MGFNAEFKGLIKLEFSEQFFEKSSNMKLHDYIFSGSGWADGQT
jgi:hypothetical protein